MWETIWQIINGESVSSFVSDNAVRINTNDSFKPLSESALCSINAQIEDAMKVNVIKYAGGKDKVDTLNDIQKRSSRLIPLIVNNNNTGTPLLQTMDSALSRDISLDGVGFDNPFDTRNIWVSPSEAASLYSRKGIPELIIEKKSNSVLLNGVRIQNPKLSPKQLDTLQEDIQRLSFDMKIAEAIRDSLVFGGSLMFPFFKLDSPASMNMTVEQLVKYGVLKKNSISRFISLDRWNTVFTPEWNPIKAGFLDPETYFVPFLGSVIRSQRCARVITSPAAGYWGTLLTLGWGVSDIPGWIESVFNYDAVMRAVPIMIEQMSILARTIDSGGMTALEGAAILDMINADNNMKFKKTTPDNIVNIDVVGKLEAIKRDFQHVPELIRLMRQDAAARARYPEELIWSSERGAFSSGDTSDSAFEKQTENVRYTHLKVAKQLKNIVMIFVINSLGPTNEVLKALPYTTIAFDNPRLTNAKDRSEIAAKVSRGIFDTVSAGMPLDIAVGMAEQLADHEFSLPTSLMEQLRKRQEEKDAHEKEKIELEIELLKVQVKQGKETGVGAPSNTSSTNTTPSQGEKKGHSYSDRLKQREHEKVGSSRGKEALTKAANKGKAKDG